MPRACRSRSGTFGGERVGRRGVTFHTASHCGENGWAVFPPSSTLSFPAEILTLFLFFPPSFFSQTLGTVRPLANLAESITLPRNRSHFSIVCSDNFRSRGFFSGDKNIPVIFVCFRPTAFLVFFRRTNPNRYFHWLCRLALWWQLDFQFCLRHLHSRRAAKFSRRKRFCRQESG